MALLEDVLADRTTAKLPAATISTRFRQKLPPNRKPALQLRNAAASFDLHGTKRLVHPLRLPPCQK